MANIRVSAQTVGGLALSVAASSASASIAVQRYRVSRTATPQNVIISSLFALPLRPLPEVSVIASELPPVMTVGLSLTDMSVAEENVAFSLDAPFVDQIDALEATEFNVSITFADSVTALETLILDKDKIVDSASAADFEIFITPGKNVADDVTVTEEVVDLSFGKALEDTALAVEVDTKDLNKSLSDDVSSDESTAIVVSLPFSDTAPAAEDSFRSLDKPFADAFSVAEVFEFAVSFNRAFSDSVNTIDTITGFSTDKGVEVLAITDFEFEFSLDKITSDDVSAAEADNKLIDKVFIDTTNTAEVTLFTPSKGLVDSVVLVDTFAFMPIKYAEDSVSVGEVISLILTSEDKFDINRLQVNVGQVNGASFEIKPTNGVLGGVLLNGLVINQST